jgi:hypothetical protein
VISSATEGRSEECSILDWELRLNSLKRSDGP